MSTSATLLDAISTLSLELNSGRHWKRRLLSVPLYVILWGLMLAGSCIVLPFVVFVDLIKPLDGPLSRSRCLLFFLLYLNIEVLGFSIATLAWIAAGHVLGLGRHRFIHWNILLQRAWSQALFHGAFRIFGMRLKVEEGAEVVPGPLLVFIRHASTADTVLPAVLVANPHEIVLRYVLKKELLWDICLDVVGNRLPNVFVDRASADPEREIATIRHAARHMGPSDGILIYPEGTRFTPRVLAYRLKRLKSMGHDELYDIAKKFNYLLPPKLGGPLALMDAAPKADILFIAHTGFEGARSFPRFWRGGLVGKTIHVRMTRFRSADVPNEEVDRGRWLFERWADMDRWVAEKQQRTD